MLHVLKMEMKDLGPEEVGSSIAERLDRSNIMITNKIK